MCSLLTFLFRIMLMKVCKLVLDYRWESHLVSLRWRMSHKRGVNRDTSLECTTIMRYVSYWVLDFCLTWITVALVHYFYIVHVVNKTSLLQITVYIEKCIFWFYWILASILISIWIWWSRLCHNNAQKH